MRWILPTEEEIKMRKDVINRIQSLILNLWPDTIIQVFGSYSTDLFLPYSDLGILFLILFLIFITFNYYLFYLSILLFLFLILYFYLLFIYFIIL